jgi:uncharacterized protein YdiU (UPF0061 family)
LPTLLIVNRQTPIFTHRFHQLGGHFYRELQPQGLQNPELIQLNRDVANALGFDQAQTKSDWFLETFSGNRIPAGSKPLAQDYAGHQFGRFNPFLGDGRVLLLGDITHVGNVCEISLKGAGATPYSRDLDGRAGISECSHEFTLSRHLAELKIPTAQHLCVIAGRDLVYRSGFERAAILTRVAPSHIRFGTFENYYFQQNHDALRQLARFVIKHHYPQFEDAKKPDYAGFFSAVVQGTAQLIASWQTHGFVHGMMNTDNQSIVGITLDLGSAAFNPNRDPDFVASKQDQQGRYAFGQQPIIGLWNCNVLARALSPLISTSALRTALNTYEATYLQHCESGD